VAALTLAQANRIIEEILERGAELACRPLSVVVVEPGAIVKAFQKEDGSSMMRFEMAFGKAYAALASAAPPSSCACATRRSPPSCAI
jgi:uncharacterized protein GlcG (DUF336 family)